MSHRFNYLCRLWELPADKASSATRENEEPSLAPQPRTPPGMSSGGRRLMEDLAQSGLSSPARPLPEKTRRRMEASLGHDLSALRVRENPAATAALGARGFTLGPEIVVDRPGEADHESLLAHEAVHWVQAARRGSVAGVSRPGGASEQEAQQAGGAVARGDAIQLSGGEPVPEIQRQRIPFRSPGPDNPVVRRESIRLLLIVHHQRQGSEGTFQLTDELRQAIRSHLPDLSDGQLTLLWTPEPASPAEAFRRLEQSGLLPRFSAPPTPREALEERVERVIRTPAVSPLPPERESGAAPFGGGFVGGHFVLNPQLPPTALTILRRHFGQRGLPLTDRDVRALLAGRRQGVAQLDRVIASLGLGLGQLERTALAERLADALLDASIPAELRRVHPTGLEASEARGERIDELLRVERGPTPSLLERIPFGVSLKVHF